ncbi:MAG: hypothetical protein ACLT38_03880 [Akkermansia sp.]
MASMLRFSAFSWSGVMVPAEMAARRACSAERLFSSSICRVSSST